ncbi:CPXCG motif-containing cysteine-rich protein [Marinobacter sp. 1Y8]
MPHTHFTHQGGQDMMLEPAKIQCPYCWEMLDISIDPSVREQHYVEDCQVCCQPILIQVVFEDSGEISVSAHAENE